MCSLDVGGTTRVYYVQLPSTYSSSKPYPVVFQFHYQGCDPGYPVTWCEFNGTHMPPSFGTSAITAFFKSF